METSLAWLDLAARYSLIASIETAATEVDIWTAVATEVSVPTVF